MKQTFKYKLKRIVHRFSWEILLSISILLFFCLSISWVIVDKAPPTWDDGMYLNHILSYYQAIKQGIHPFITSIINTDRGRVPMGTLFALPLTLLFGPSEYSAILTLNLCWFVFGWSTFYIGKNIFSKKAGLFAFILLALLPIYQVISHYYFIDFYLSSVIMLCISLIILNLKKENSFFWILGIVLGIGVLVKVTFIIFLIGPLLIYLVYSLKKFKQSPSILIKSLLALCIGILISGPYIFINIGPLFEQTLWLNSSKLAAMYSTSNPFSFHSFINYIVLQFRFFIGIIVAFGAIMGVITFFRHRHHFSSTQLLNISILFGSTLPAWFIFGFGYIQDSRYIMPALPLFTFFSAYFFSSKKMQYVFYLICGVGLLILIASIFRVENIYDIYSDEYPVVKYFGYTQPDNRDWQIPETIIKLRKLLDENKLGNRQLLFLGGNKEYHTALFSYFSRLQNDPINFHTLPYYTLPNMTTLQTIEYIAAQNFPAILYKTGPNYPDFSSKNDKSVTQFFDSNQDEFKKYNLGISLPDGNQYFVYFPQNCTILSDTSSLNSMFKKSDYKFGDNLELKATSFENHEAYYTLNLYWKLVGTMPEGYTRFVHLIATDDTLISQKDESFASTCINNLKSGDVFLEQIILTNEEMEKVSKIKTGLYIAPNIETVMKISPSNDTDWNSTRLTIFSKQ